MKSADWIPIVHGIERSHLIYPHRRHFQYSRHLIHYADTREAMLSLPEIQQGHHRRLLVLAGIPGQYLSNELLIRLIELERDGRVIVVGIAVLQ